MDFQSKPLKPWETQEGKLKGLLKNKIFFCSSFDTETQNNLSDENTIRIYEQVLNKIKMEDFIKILETLGFKKEIRYFSIRQGNSNDGTFETEQFKGTYYEIEKYIETELIGTENIKYWNNNDGDYTHYPYEDNEDYCQIIEFYEITEQDYEEYQKELKEKYGDFYDER